MVGIRELRADEVSFLKDMLYTAIAWNPERQLPLPKAELLELPQLTIFHEGWGREGDTALAAELEGQLVGLVWYRFFTEDVHGEGFVDEATPEVAIAVVEGQRGNGIGAALMQAIHERARADGVARVSLSVDHDNPARRLYERLGYVDVAEGDERMVLDLA
jgi:GNAT superfamily N-acetyltransferase